MTDIFISYTTADRETVRTLAGALESEGWDVWWDREIPAGVTFETYIEERLNEAACAMVVWSKNSVNSMWVRAEANEAMAQSKLVPVLIDDAQPPLVFRQIQTADLRGWSGDANDQRFRKLVGDLGNLIGRSKPADTESRPADAIADTAVQEPQQTTEHVETRTRGPSEPTGGGGGKWLWAVIAILALLGGGAAVLFYLETVEPPSIVRFEATPSVVAQGDETELVWETTGAKVVTLLPDQRVKATDSLRVQPDATTQYRLSAENRGGKTTQSVLVTVLTSARIEEFSAAPTGLVEGESTILRWRTNSAVRVQIAGSGELEPSGRMELRPDRTTEYTLTVLGEDSKEVTQSVRVEVEALPDAKILGFGPERKSIERGDKTLLRWQTENADRVELDGKPVEASGSVMVAPSKTTTYQLTAIGKSGDRTSHRTEVTVLAPSPAEILAFEAKSTKIARGKGTTLAWRTQNAVKVELNGKPVEPSGSAEVSPSKTKDYRLVVTSKSGATTDQVVKLTVVKPADPKPVWLVLSGGGAPLESSAVVEAFAVGVDWEYIIERLLKGKGVVPGLDMPIGSGRKSVAKTAYDPKTALALLAKAGYPKGFEVYLYVDNEKMMDFGKLVADFLRRIGVSADLKVIPADAARSRAVGSHEKGSKKPVLFLDFERT